MACHISWQTSQDLQNPACQVRVHREAYNTALSHGLSSSAGISVFPALMFHTVWERIVHCPCLRGEPEVMALFQTVWKI